MQQQPRFLGVLRLQGLVDDVIPLFQKRFSNAPLASRFWMRASISGLLRVMVMVTLYGK
jgi:hypothetical protein